MGLSKMTNIQLKYNLIHLKVFFMSISVSSFLKVWPYKKGKWSQKEKLMSIIRWIALISLLVSFISCGTDSTADQETEDTQTTEQDSTSVTDSEEDYPDPNALWYYDYNQDTILQVKAVTPDNNPGTSKLINLINKSYQDKVYLEFVKESNDTLYVKTEDSEHLSQRMGSAGSYEYMIIATFTLTEARSIEYVDFAFDYGDHANPGTYSRSQFLSEMKARKEANKGLYNE